MQIRKGFTYTEPILPDPLEWLKDIDFLNPAPFVLTNPAYSPNIDWSFLEHSLSDSEYVTSPSDSYYNIDDVSSSKSNNVDALLGEHKWRNKTTDSSDKTTITYSFVNLSASRFAQDYSEKREYESMRELSAAQKTLVREVLASISDVCKITFVEVSETATQCGVIRYAFTTKTSSNSAGHAYMPGTTPASGDVWLSTTISDAQSASRGYFLKHAILHETLHALGLKHPHEADPPFYKTLPAREDIIPTTVMSYNHVYGEAGTLSLYPQEPRVYDVLALTSLYGVAVKNGSDTIYDLSKPEYRQWKLIHDTGGIDTFDASSLTGPVKLRLTSDKGSDIGVDIPTSPGKGYNATLSISPYSTIERAIGSRFSDELLGSVGNNTLQGGAGNDTIDGGNGRDTAVYQGRRAEYSISKQSSGSISVVDSNFSRDGSDTLTNIERIRFSDVTVAFDIQAGSGQVYRIYKAAFNRDPVQGDKSGLGYWISRADSGDSMANIASGFVNSNEFKVNYGTNPTNAQFLTKLYQNVLGRQPEASGYNWWLNQLNTNPEKTKAKVLADFAESAENQTGVLGLIGNGITYEPWVG